MIIELLFEEKRRPDGPFPLGVEFLGKRLTASFKLSRNDLLSHLPEEGDRDAFVGRLWELCFNEEDIPEACKALRLRESTHP